ncbi:unnamed protein product [Spodoptera exigua]|nr:unnamed protein product [Spodoptera exigua]
MCARGVRHPAFVASGDNLAAPPPRCRPDPASRRAAADACRWGKASVHELLESSNNALIVGTGSEADSDLQAPPRRLYRHAGDACAGAAARPNDLPMLNKVSKKTVYLLNLFCRRKSGYATRAQLRRTRCNTMRPRPPLSQTYLIDATDNIQQLNNVLSLLCCLEIRSVGYSGWFLDLVPSSKDKAFTNLVPVGAGKACDVDSAAIIVRQRAGVWCGGVEGVVPAPGAKMATVINWRDAGANRDASRSQRGIAPACTVNMVCEIVGCF